MSDDSLPLPRRTRTDRSGMPRDRCAGVPLYDRPRKVSPAEIYPQKSAPPGGRPGRRNFYR